MGRSAEDEAELKSPIRHLADELLWRDAIDNRAAIQGNRRVEVFRGKDFCDYFRANPSKLDALPLTSKGKRIDDQIAEAASLFIKSYYFSRSERVCKTPHPRRKKLTKFPRKVFHTEDQKFVEGSFYTWLHQRPPTPWMKFVSWALALLLFCCCLFPLAPLWMKLGVFYASLSTLALIFGTLAVRAVVYATVWTLLGRHIWVIPNLLADAVPLNEIFSPMVQEERDASGKPYPAPPVAHRLGAVGLAAATLAYMYVQAPEKGYARTMKTAVQEDAFNFLLNHASVGMVEGGQGEPVETAEGGEAAGGADVPPEAEESDDIPPPPEHDPSEL